MELELGLVHAVSLVIWARYMCSGRQRCSVCKKKNLYGAGHCLQLKKHSMKIQDVSVSGLSVSVAVGIVLQVPLFKRGTYNCSFKALIRIPCLFQNKVERICSGTCLFCDSLKHS